MAVNYYKPNEPDKSDPRVHGPWLDDIRAEQERARSEARRSNGGKHKKSKKSAPEEEVEE